MPKLTNNYVKRPQRILVVGDPSSGKTTAIGHLAEHGQKLFVADFDGKLNTILKHVPARYHENIVYADLKDPQKFDPSSGRAVSISKPPAYSRFMRLVDHWIDDDGADYGDPRKWPENHWFIVDSLTTYTQAVMRWVKHDRSVMTSKTSGPTIGEVIDRVEMTVGLFLSYPVNMIMLSHLRASSAAEKDSFGDDNKKQELKAEAISMRADRFIRYPHTIGRDMPRYIGGYFNAVIQAKIVGSGRGSERVLSTIPDDDVLVNVPVSNKELPPEVPINQLYKIIEAMRKTS